VHDGQQLGAEVVVQVGRNAFPLALDHLIHAQFGKLGIGTLGLGRGLADAPLDQAARVRVRLA
jgi:hypothetical protein